MRAQCLMLLFRGGIVPVGKKADAVGVSDVSLSSAGPAAIAMAAAQQAAECFGKSAATLLMASHHRAAATTSVGRIPSLQVAFEQLNQLEALSSGRHWEGRGSECVQQGSLPSNQCALLGQVREALSTHLGSDAAEGLLGHVSSYIMNA